MSRARIITILIVLLGLALVYAWVATPKQRRVATTEKNSTSRQASSAEKAVVVPVIENLTFSAQKKTQFNPPKKNLFGPLYSAPEKPVRPNRAPVKAKKPLPRPQVIEKAPKIVAPRAPAPIQPLKVLGFLNKDGMLTVFLAAAKGEIYLVKQGDDFANDLNAEKITADEIRITRTQTDQQVVLPLGKGETQRIPNIRLQSDRPKFEMPQKIEPDKAKPDDSPVQTGEKVEK